MELAGQALASFGTALLLIGVYLFASGSRPIRSKKQVIVYLESGQTIKGLLLHRRPTLIEIGSPKLLTGDQERPMDGTVEIDRRNVVWIQIT